MPELPEVETVRRGLQVALSGRKITAVQILRKESVAHPQADLFCQQLSGKHFLQAERRGKYLLFRLSEDASLVSHLRMSGRFLIVDSQAAAEPHWRVRMQLDNNEDLIFEDMRVFGRLWLIAAGEDPLQIVGGLKSLGVEPLDSLEIAYLKESFDGKKQPIKTALLDQTIIAGIGNIYADESLFLSGIHPLRTAGSLKAPDLQKLIPSIQKVLTTSLKQGGTTLRNYTNHEGINGNYQHKAYVYGRYGLPCKLCKTPIERIKIAGRSSHFCPHCQKYRHSQEKHAQEKVKYAQNLSFQNQADC